MQCIFILFVGLRDDLVHTDTLAFLCCLLDLKNFDANRFATECNGDYIADFVGPLGNPSEFVKMSDEELRSRHYLFVAGGVGTAPVYPGCCRTDRRRQRRRRGLLFPGIQIQAGKNL